MDINEILSFNPVNKENFEDLIKDIDNIIPFVGAGMSAFAYPMWGEFLKQTIIETDLIDTKEKENLFKLLSESKNEEVADIVGKEMGNTFFIKRVQRSYSVNKMGKCLSKMAVGRLPEIFTKGIITTNFDRVLENVYKNSFSNIVYPGQKSLETESVQRNLYCLFKIHGDVENIDSIIFTKKQYEENYGDSGVDYQKPLPNLLKRIFQNKEILFLGCSLRNDRTMMVIDELGNYSQGITHFTFLPKPLDDDKYKDMNNLLNQHSIYPIWYPEGEHQCVQILLDEVIKRSKKKR